MVFVVHCKGIQPVRTALNRIEVITKLLALSIVFCGELTCLGKPFEEH